MLICEVHSFEKHPYGCVQKVRVLDFDVCNEGVYKRMDVEVTSRPSYRLFGHTHISDADEFGRRCVVAVDAWSFRRRGQRQRSRRRRHSASSVVNRLRRLRRLRRRRRSSASPMTASAALSASLAYSSRRWQHHNAVADESSEQPRPHKCAGAHHRADITDKKKEESNTDVEAQRIVRKLGRR